MDDNFFTSEQVINGRWVDITRWKSVSEKDSPWERVYETDCPHCDAKLVLRKWLDPDGVMKWEISCGCE